MFVSRRKYNNLKAQYDFMEQCKNWDAEIAEEAFEENVYLRETNIQWKDLYEYMLGQVEDLYAENERLRSWNYDLMGYEDDIEVPF